MERNWFKVSENVLKDTSRVYQEAQRDTLVHGCQLEAVIELDKKICACSKHQRR